MSNRLKEIMSDIVDHCDSGADNDYEIKITNGDLIRWYDGLEVVQVQMRDAAIQVETKEKEARDLKEYALAAMKDACDLLAERRHGSPARSPGHNTRLLLENAIKRLTFSSDERA